MLIAIEGIDCSGKSTIVSTLNEYLSSKGYSTKVIKFPIYDSPSGEIIKNYLSGKYIQNLNPWIISTLFDLDKFNYKPQLLDNIDNNDFVILDRYILSNITYSIARMGNVLTNDVINQLLYLNFEIFTLPKPDVTFIMDVSIDRFLEIQQNKDFDILESNLDLIRRCDQAYSQLEYHPQTGTVIKIPYIPVEDRLKSILKILEL